MEKFHDEQDWKVFQSQDDEKYEKKYKYDLQLLYHFSSIFSYLQRVHAVSMTWFTVHFKMKKMSNKSSLDFECVLHTSDTYW